MHAWLSPFLPRSGPWQMQPVGLDRTLASFALRNGNVHLWSGARLSILVCAGVQKEFRFVSYGWHPRMQSSKQEFWGICEKALQEFLEGWHLKKSFWTERVRKKCSLYPELITVLSENHSQWDFTGQLPPKKRGRAMMLLSDQEAKGPQQPKEGRRSSCKRSLRVLAIVCENEVREKRACCWFCFEERYGFRIQWRMHQVPSPHVHPIHPLLLVVYCVFSSVKSSFQEVVNDVMMPSSERLTNLRLTTSCQTRNREPASLASNSISFGEWRWRIGAYTRPNNV